MSTLRLAHIRLRSLASLVRNAARAIARLKEDPDLRAGRAYCDECGESDHPWLPCCQYCGAEDRLMIGTNRGHSVRLHREIPSVVDVYVMPEDLRDRLRAAIFQGHWPDDRKRLFQALFHPTAH